MWHLFFRSSREERWHRHTLSAARRVSARKRCNCASAPSARVSPRTNGAASRSAPGTRQSSIDSDRRPALLQPAPVALLQYGFAKIVDDEVQLPDSLDRFPGYRLRRRCRPGQFPDPIEAWVTNADRSSLFQKLPEPLAFGAANNPRGPVIVIDAAQQMQSARWIRVCVDGGSAELLVKMSAAARSKILKQIFAREGLGSAICASASAPRT